MKNFKIEAGELLQRNELKSVFGGFEGSCSADCGEDSCGRSVKTSCNGSPCSAVDNVGCASTTEAETCRSAVSASNKTCPRF